jgi:diguanylate cyclase (GGDEF)-like protein/PAS domain S-box-containing protein
MPGPSNIPQMAYPGFRVEVRSGRSASDIELVELPAELARAIVSHSSDGLVVVDADGTLRFASAAADSMLGYAPGATVGRNAFDLVHPDDQVGALEGFESTMGSSDSRPLPLLVRLRCADGSWLQTEIIATNHLGDEHVGGLLLNIRDVERSMRTEAALRESEAHHRLIVELAREGIWTVDALGRTTFANRAMAEMLDTTVSEMLECSMFDFVDGEKKAVAADNVERFQAAAGAEEHDIQLTTRSGRSVWTRMNTSPITDHAGTYRGAIALVTDITERRVLEQRLAADAREDALTGIANRTALFESLGAKLAAGHWVAALYIDLDDFKNANDAFGHAVGDEVLRTVASRLSGVVRAGDIVARVGGDEFVVVSDAFADPKEAIALGCRIRDVLARRVSLAATEVEIGASVGIAWVCGADADSLLSDADRALYCAKRAGRGRVEMSDASATNCPPSFALRRIERALA